MKKINSYDELNDLIMRHLKRGVYTNCFISKEEFEDEIKNQKLFYYLYDGGLLIFRKMNGYFKMNFYINDPEKKIDFNFNEVIVTEIVSKSNYDYLPIINFFEQNGFVSKLKRVRLCNENSNIQVDTKNVEKSNLKYYEEIVKLLEKNFDKYIGCIPREENLELDIKSGNFYCYKENEKLLGILHIKNERNISNIKHLAVDENHRGRGIAKMMLSQYFLDNPNSKKYVWTGENNEAAKNTYFSMGYKLDGCVSQVLMHTVN